MSLKLDPHADIGALTPNADWTMRCFIHHPFFTNQHLVSKRRRLYEDLG